MKFDLFKQGLLLVLVPVSFQIAFVIVLALLLQQAEHEIGEEKRSNTLVIYCQDIQHQFLEAAGVVTAYRKTREESLFRRYRGLMRRAEADLEEMSTAVSDNANEREVLNKLKDTTKKCLSAFDHHVELIRLTGSGSETGPEMQLATGNFIRASEKFIRAQRLEVQKAPEESARRRREIVNALSIGSLIDLLIGIGLVVFFAKGTVKRLGTLIENTHRLTKREKLLKPISGSDEIAHLDKVFHDMATSLDEAARHKQELVQMVSHDLRTPLTSVQMSLSSLADGIYGEISTPALKQIRISEFNITRLIHMIRDLLDIERLEAGKLEMDISSVSLEEVIHQSVSAVEAYAERTEITIEHPQTKAKIEADSERLIQVLINLLSNAIKFSPKKSTITIEVNESPEWTEIRIADRGRGIPPEFLTSVFDRFQQVSVSDAKKQHGSGLGLAIAKAIVEAHNGTIGVESKMGEGSTFWLRIPSVQPVESLPIKEV